MFITVKYGHDLIKIFNPNCRMINLMADVKKRCCLTSEADIDFTDESGRLINITAVKPYDSALQTLSPQSTYILVEKVLTKELKKGVEISEELHELVQQGVSMVSGSHSYIPLLHDIIHTYPDYKIHSETSAQPIKKHPKRRPSRVSTSHSNSPRTRNRRISTVTRY